MEIFRGIDLNDSFVLGWRDEADKVVFNLELSIWPESPWYEKPRAQEYTCYKRGKLNFSGVREVSGFLPIKGIPSSRDLNGTDDYGNIDVFRLHNDTYQVQGDFGDVEILGGNVSLTLDEV